EESSPQRRRRERRERNVEESGIRRQNSLPSSLFTLRFSALSSAVNILLSSFRRGQLLLQFRRGFADALAARILAAAPEPALSPVAQFHRIAAVGAVLRGVHLGRFLLRRRRRQVQLGAQLLRDRFGTAALGISGASQKRPTRAFLDR